MNKLQVTEFMNRSSLIFERVAKFIASRDKSQLLDEWHSILKDSHMADVMAVVTAMSKGDIKPVGDDAFEIGRYPSIVLFEANMIKASRKKRGIAPEQEQRYRCLQCRDTGIVNVWNPNFVKAYEEKFKEIERVKIDRAIVDKDSKIGKILERFDPDEEIEHYQFTPPNWQSLAVIWWRSYVDKGGPIHHLACCNCDGEKTSVLDEQRRDWLRGERKRKDGSHQGLPACGAAKYIPHTMPLKTPLAYEDLLAWYSEDHEIPDSPVKYKEFV